MAEPASMSASVTGGGSAASSQAHNPGRWKTKREKSALSAAAAAASGDQQHNQQDGTLANHGNNQQQAKVPPTKLSAAAPAFSMPDDFVPSYRPPEAQIYKQLERQHQQPQAPSSVQTQPLVAKHQQPQQPAAYQPSSVVSAPSSSSGFDLDDVPRFRPPEAQPYQRMEQRASNSIIHHQPSQPAERAAGNQPRNAPVKGQAAAGGQQPQQGGRQPYVYQPNGNSSGASSAFSVLASAAIPPSASSAAPASQPQPQQSSFSGRGRGGKQQRGEQRADGPPHAKENNNKGQKQAKQPQADAASQSAKPAAAAASASSSSSQSQKSAAWREGHVDNSLLAKNITEQLMTNTYECSICMLPVGRRGQIWSCTECHIILHLTCIDKWYESNRSQSLGDPSWRCPGCMFVRTDPPGEYYCYCGKTFEPDHSAFLTPHSCGQPCGKLKNCQLHTCSLPCHPGFCPKCTLPGPMSTCACGATEHRLKCGEPDVEKPTCNKVCEKPLKCGSHQCQRGCHNGPCAECTDKQELTCFCGQVHETRMCGQAGTVADPIDADPERKSFACANVCGKQLDCGNCKCTQRCHSGACRPCDRQPPVSSEASQSCACGKVSHTGKEIESVQRLKVEWTRSSCTDALPSCGGKCGKLLNCSYHTCSLPCHDTLAQPCGMVRQSESSGRMLAPSVGCSEVVKRQCRCALHTVVDVPCVQIRGDTLRGIPPPPSHLPPPVMCDVRCRVKLACRKHTCTNVCCPVGETHVCVKVCGKPLACSKHSCDQFCHLGACSPCGVVHREGLSCQCGRTRTGPNVKCGTPLPQCRYPCSRERACGHKCIVGCHEGPCPPCVTLVEKTCAGGHKTLKSIPCYASPSCGITCKKLLRCGIHSCQKPCHAGKCTVALGSQVDPMRKGWSINPSNAASIFGAATASSSSSSAASQEQKDAAAEEDDDSVRTCGQKCGLLRSDCNHACTQACHPFAPCPTNVPCKADVRIYCECKRLSKVVQCGNAGQGEMGGLARVLPCTTQCEVETRNARFRDALQLDESRVTIPYPSELLDRCIELIDFDFLLRIERTLGEFINMTSSSSKTLNPMKNDERWLVHQYSSYCGLESESFDQEPRRAVRLIKPPGAGDTVAMPKMKISDAIKLYRANKGNTGNQTRGTVGQSNVIHLWDLDTTPVITPADLTHALRPYALDAHGQPNHNFRLNFLSHSHALLLFNDPSLAANVRVALERRNLFRFAPDELATKEAAQAYLGAYQSNSLFRRHQQGEVKGKKPAAAAASSSSFDDWSDARTGASTAASTSPPKPASSTASSARAPEDQSDAMSDADLAAFVSRTADSAFPSSYPAPTAGSVMLQAKAPVKVAQNQWDALEEDEEEETATGSTRKQRRRAAAAAAASSDASAADGEEDWSALAAVKPRKLSAEPPAAPAAKDAFDD